MKGIDKDFIEAILSKTQEYQQRYIEAENFLLDLQNSFWWKFSKRINKFLTKQLSMYDSYSFFCETQDCSSLSVGRLHTTDAGKSLCLSCFRKNAELLEKD